MSRHDHHLPWAEYLATLKPHERPMMPGSPASPDHPWPRRLHYGLVGVLIALNGSLGNAAVTANLPQLAGALGITTTEAAWLPIVFVMTNASMSLLLIKFRMQYGLRLFTLIILPAFVAVSLAHLFVNSFPSAVAARAVAGMSGSGMTTLGFLYLLQAFPARHRPKGLVIAIGMPSLAIPLARIFSTPLLDLGGWQAVYLLELGLAVLALAAVWTLRMPPSERIKVYDPLDFVTFALFAPGVALLCAVLGMGRLMWWTDTAWIGWALAGAIVLLTAAFMVEHRRETPLINLRWMAGPDIARLAVSILLVRVVLSEQTAGAVGFLQQLGVGPDQLHGLFRVILAATAAGTLVSAWTLRPTRLWAPVSIALGLIAVGAFMDSHATNLVRPQNLYVSQSLLAFASALFIGPAMMIGISQVMQKGFANMVSFIIVFSAGQNIGGLAGSALVGTVQQVRARDYVSHLSERLIAGDPQVAQRLQQLGGAYGRTVGDAGLRGVEGLRLFQQQVTQQANVLAYNDVFLMLAVTALAAAGWTTFVHFRPRLKARREARAAARAVDAGPGAVDAVAAVE